MMTRRRDGVRPTNSQTPALPPSPPPTRPRAAGTDSPQPTTPRAPPHSTRNLDSTLATTHASAPPLGRAPLAAARAALARGVAGRRHKRQARPVSHAKRTRRQSRRRPEYTESRQQERAAAEHASEVMLSRPPPAPPLTAPGEGRSGGRGRGERLAACVTLLGSFQDMFRAKGGASPLCRRCGWLLCLKYPAGVPQVSLQSSRSRPSAGRE